MVICLEYINRKPLIICVCGKARSGKSTISKYLENIFVNDGKKVIFSPYTKYLKQYIRDITGSDVTEENKPRELLQKLSSELIKGILDNKDFFINRQIEDIEFYSYFADVIIISDVRFPSEISSLKNKFDRVISIGVIRDNYVSDLSLSEQRDITEVALIDYDEYDYVINNSDDINLEQTVVGIALDLRKNGIYE